MRLFISSEVPVCTQAEDYFTRDGMQRPDWRAQSAFNRVIERAISQEWWDGAFIWLFGDPRFTTSWPDVRTGDHTFVPHLGTTAYGHVPYAGVISSGGRLTLSENPAELPGITVSSLSFFIAVSTDALANVVGEFGAFGGGRFFQISSWNGLRSGAWPGTASQLTFAGTNSFGVTGSVRNNVQDPLGSGFNLKANKTYNWTSNDLDILPLSDIRALASGNSADVSANQLMALIIRPGVDMTVAKALALNVTLDTCQLELGLVPDDLVPSEPEDNYFTQAMIALVDPPDLVTTSAVSPPAASNSTTEATYAFFPFRRVSARPWGGGKTANNNYQILTEFVWMNRGRGLVPGVVLTTALAANDVFGGIVNSQGVPCRIDFNTYSLANEAWLMYLMWSLGYKPYSDPLGPGGMGWIDHAVAGGFPVGPDWPLTYYGESLMADMTGSGWAKVNGTALKNQTAVNGRANGAYSFTADSPAATILRSYTIPSGEQEFVYAIKRLIGTGEGIEVTLDNGATWTPIPAQTNLTGPLSTINGSPTVTVTDTAHGLATGDWVTIVSVGATVGGISAANLQVRRQVTRINANVYTYVAGASATSSESGGGGAVVAQYPITATYQTFKNSQTLADPTIGFRLPNTTDSVGIDIARIIGDSAYFDTDCTMADMTTSLWAKSSCTALQNINSASTPTVPLGAFTVIATGAMATIARSYVLASAAQIAECHLKRVTGTGTIEWSMDDGLSWTTVVLTSSWQRFSLTQTLANPVIKFRISTSGDEIAVDGARLKGGYFEHRAYTVLYKDTWFDQVSLSGGYSISLDYALLSPGRQVDATMEYDGFEVDVEMADDRPGSYLIDPAQRAAAICTAKGKEIGFCPQAITSGTSQRCGYNIDSAYQVYNALSYQSILISALPVDGDVILTLDNQINLLKGPLGTNPIDYSKIALQFTGGNLGNPMSEEIAQTARDWAIPLGIRRFVYARGGSPQGSGPFRFWNKIIGIMHGLTMPTPP